MSNALLELRECVNDYYADVDFDDDDQKVRTYAKTIFSRILQLSNGCLTLKKQTHSEITLPPILRSMIEASVDLQLLRVYPSSYPFLLDLASLKQTRIFIRYYNDAFRQEINDATDYSDRLRSIETEIRNLEREIVRFNEFNFETKSSKDSTSFKFQLLRDLENPKRHKKYEFFFDILSAHSHHNLLFFEEDGIKDVADIQRHIVHYDDLVASILKNGLINLVNIYDMKISKKSFSKLKELKKNVKKDNQFLFEGLPDIYRSLFDTEDVGDDED